MRQNVRNGRQDRCDVEIRGGSLRALGLADAFFAFGWNCFSFAKSGGQGPGVSGRSVFGLGSKIFLLARGGCFKRTHES